MKKTAENTKYEYQFHTNADEEFFSGFARRLVSVNAHGSLVIPQTRNSIDRLPWKGLAFFSGSSFWRGSFSWHKIMRI